MVSKQHKTIVTTLCKTHLKNYQTQVEYRHQQINRISDIALPNEKIAIEVQCSPITTKEVKARFYDYHSIGWEVVWILSDRCFNQKKAYLPELTLRSYQSYYCSLVYDQLIVYDQIDKIIGRQRIHTACRLPIETFAFRPIPILPRWAFSTLPSIHQATLCTPGDLIDMIQKHPARIQQTLAQLPQLERESKKEKFRNRLRKLILKWN